MYIPVSNDINNPEKGFYAPYKNKIPKIPLTQNYHIHLSDPSKQVSMLNRIYEDMVPNNPFPLSYIKVSERLDNMKFIRNSMVKVNDGEEMTLVGSDDSFLSYVKLLKFNPYSLMTNPYRDLAKGFMLFNIAYPITFNKVSELIELPRTTMGYNLRIYELSIGAYKCSQLNSKINCHNFDVWRDINYYKYIKSHIIEKYQSPNFVNMILYKIDIQSQVDWNELSKLKLKSMPTEDYRDLQSNNRLINKHITDTENPQLPSNVVRLLVQNNNNPLKMHYADINKKQGFGQVQVLKNTLAKLQADINTLSTKPANNENMRYLEKLKKRYGTILTTFNSEVIYPNNGNNQNLDQLLNNMYDTQGEIRRLELIRNRSPDEESQLLKAKNKLLALLEKIQAGTSNSALEDLEIDLTENSGYTLEQLIFVVEVVFHNLNHVLFQISFYYLISLHYL